MPFPERLEFCRLETAGRIATVSLARVDRRNALHYAMVDELLQVVRELNQDTRFKILVLQADGPVFCAGLDWGYLSKLQEFGPDENAYDANHLAELYLTLYQSPKLTICGVQGLAVGAGVGLALACDLILLKPDAHFRFKEGEYGLVPSAYLPFLLRKAGEAFTRQALLFGQDVSAEQWQAHGLASAILSADSSLPETLQAEARRLCQQISHGSIDLTKKLLADLPTMPLIDAARFTARMSGYSRVTVEGKAGVLAMQDKQRLDWS